MLDYISAMVDFFPEVGRGAKTCGLKPQALVRKAVRQYLREFVPQNSRPDELLETEHGKLSPDDARALYKRLSSYFARKGGEGVPRKVRKERGLAGAKKRWGSKKG